jgi:hypothetical protein
MTFRLNDRPQPLERFSLPLHLLQLKTKAIGRRQ